MAAKPILGLQFHPEINETKLLMYAECGEGELAPSRQAATAFIQDRETLMTNLRRSLSETNAVADCIFSKWLSYVKR